MPIIEVADDRHGLCFRRNANKVDRLGHFFGRVTVGRTKRTKVRMRHIELISYRGAAIAQRLRFCFREVLDKTWRRTFLLNLKKERAQNKLFARFTARDAL